MLGITRRIIIRGRCVLEGNSDVNWILAMDDSITGAAFRLGFAQTLHAV